MTASRGDYNIFQQLTSCRALQGSNLAGTYFNGNSNNGVGATLTATGTGALVIDGVSVVANDSVLLIDQTAGNQNGIYFVVSAGATSSVWQLQRRSDFQSLEQMQLGQFLSISAGTDDAGSMFVLTEPLPIQFGVPGTGNNITFTASPLDVDLGTAATKTASNNSDTYVASTAGTQTVNHIAVFADTNGTLTEDVSPAINGGNIQAGLSGTAGTLASFPATATTGSLVLAGVASSGNYNVTISNRSHGQASVYSIADVGQATGSIMNCKVVADPGANLITFDVTCGQAALATAGTVTLIASSGSKQYKVRNLWINSGGTNFSGGSGNRLGQVTDGTTVYSVIPATNMQTLVNAGWGMSTPLPFPAAAAINTSTVAGANLVFSYSGGTTDYTAGSIVVTGMVERVA